MAPLGARDAKLGLPLPRWHRDSAQHKCTQSGRSERPIPDSATVGVSHHAAASLPCVVRRHLSDGGAASRRATSARPNRASRGARFAVAKQRSAGHRRASGGHTACVILRCVVPDESTASDAVQLLKLVSDAAGRRDLGAITALYAPDGVWDLSPIRMGTFEGHAAIRGFMEDWFGSYEEWEREAEELLDVGNGVAFAVWLREAVLVAAAARSDFATRPSCCAKRARLRESRTTRTSMRPVAPRNVSPRSGPLMAEAGVPREGAGAPPTSMLALRRRSPAAPGGGLLLWRVAMMQLAWFPPQGGRPLQDDPQNDEPCKS